MKYGKLGHSGIAISRFALGTMYFGSETSEDDAFAIIDRYVEAGGNALDTADVYVGGKAEETVGKWFASRPADVTDKVMLNSKGRATADPSPGPNGQGLSRRYLRQALDASLKRLGRDHIDLYQLHASDMHTPVEETIAFLAEARAAGKINYVGLSNFTGWQLQLFVSTAKAMGGPVPISFQIQYSLMSRESEWELVPAAIHNDVGILPWSPLAGGFLSGKYQRGGKPDTGTRAGSDKDLYQWTSAEYAESDQNWATIDAVVDVAKQLGVTPSQVALAWIADRPGVAAPVFGARTLKQLEENLGAVDLTLDAAATARLEEVSRPKPGGYPYGAFGQGATQPRHRRRRARPGNPGEGRLRPPARPGMTEGQGETPSLSSLSRRSVMAFGATAGAAAVLPSAATGAERSSGPMTGSRIDPNEVQLLFADLQVPLVAGSLTQPPERLERSAAVLAEVGALLSLPTLFSVVMEGSSAPHLLPALKPYAREGNTLLRIPVAPFHDAATAAAIAKHRRRILVIAGFAAEVVVLQAALDAVAAGHEAYFVTDAIGSRFERTETAAFREMEMAGAKPTSVLSLVTRMVPDFVGTPGKQVFAALKPVLGQ